MEIKAEEIKLDLLENGLDFVSSAIGHILKDNNSNSLKYAILHLAGGTELILKAALFNEHWSLIFENINLAQHHLLTSGDFRSVDFESILTRLENVCHIHLGSKSPGVLRDLRKRRNKMEHFGFQENPVALKSISSKVLSFLLSFINENFTVTTLSEVSKEYIEILRSQLPAFKEFVTLRLAQVKETLQIAEKNFQIEYCPMCRQHSFILNEDLTCVFCGYSDEPDKIANLYAENILNINSYISFKDGGEFPVYDCFQCLATNTLVDKGEDYICFNCLASLPRPEVKECPGCGQLYQFTEDDAAICNYCIEQQLKEWD